MLQGAFMSIVWGRVLLPNGEELLLNGSWSSMLHARFPHARRVAVWSAVGEELSWSWQNGTRGSVRAVGGTQSAGRLQLVVDSYPFMWSPSTAGSTMTIHTSDGKRHRLKTLSQKPRVFLVEDFLSRAECDVIRRLAEPRIKASTTGGSLFMDSVNRLKSWLTGMPPPRNSQNAFLHWSHCEGSSEDARLLRRAWERVASLVRAPASSAEPMQIVHYRVGQHFYYHLDNAGSPKGRATTALLYLNDNVGGGGETNFPMASRANTMYRQEQVLSTFNNCQTASGLTVPPRAGSVVLFYGMYPNSQRPDMWPWHGSCDVTHGEKWLANMWFAPRAGHPGR